MRWSEFWDARNIMRGIISAVRKKSRIGSQCLGVVIGLSHASLEESFARYTTRSGVNHVANKLIGVFV